MSNTEQLPYQTEKSGTKSCSQKFSNIHRKTSVLESLFHEVAGFQAFTFIEKRLQHRCFPVAKFLWNAYFEEYLNMAASKLFLQKWLFRTLFLDSPIQNHPDSVILQAHQWLSNQSLKHNPAYVVFILNH